MKRLINWLKWACFYRFKKPKSREEAKIKLQVWADKQKPWTDEELRGGK